MLSPHDPNGQLTVVMRDSRLEQFMTRDSGLMWIRHNVYHGDSVKPDHLLEVDEASIVAIHILDRETIICSVPIGLEDIAPVRTWRFRHCHVQEDGVGAGLQNSICLKGACKVIKVENEVS